MASPLIRVPQVQGGTFYGFSSAARDLSKTFNNEQLKFQFSKFALLNIPDIDVPANKQNFIQFRTIDGAIFNGLNADNNINLAESFQNYALNIETLLLEDDDFDSSIKRTVSERVFFKWLKELGGIRFREALDSEKNTAVEEDRFVEENTILSGTQRYRRVVEYIGDIDVVNNVTKAGNTYTEIFFNVPNRVGNTPVVLFEAIEDVNYSPSKIISPGNNEFISGRNSSTIHPDGLSVNAFYDFDAAVTYTDPDANWHGSLSTDSYYTEPDQFNNPDNLEITKVASDYPGADTFSDITYLRSQLDGISIDFTAENYSDIAIDPKISTIQEYNSALKAKNFEFNAILVYYDIFDVSNPEDRATNLYGVIFLDNVTQTGSTSFIQRLQKIKPNNITGLNGNSYALKLNVKFDTSVDNAAIETIINDFTTFSMDLFIDASVQLQEAATVLLNSQKDIQDLSNKVNNLENLVFTSENVTEIKERLDLLESNVQNAGLALQDPESLLDLISNNSDAIQDIANGEVPVQLQYNTEVLRAGDGIEIDKSVLNKIKIVNKNQKYNINEIFKDINFTTRIDASNKLDLNQSVINAYIKLESFTNLIRLNIENEALSNINILIDDSNFRFKEGQVVRIVFEDDLDINGKNILFFTDKLDRFGFGALNKSIGTITFNELLSDKPIIEVICLDEIEYIFGVDILR